MSDSLDNGYRKEVQGMFSKIEIIRIALQGKYYPAHYIDKA